MNSGHRDSEVEPGASSRVRSQHPEVEPHPQPWLKRHGVALSNTLLVLGGAILILAALFMWAEATVFDSDGFADAASDSLQDDAVQDRLADRLADRIVENDPERARARPLIVGATSAFIDSTQFESIFRAAVERLHERVFDENRNELLLDLTAALARIVELIQTASPELAARIPPNLESGLVTISESDARTRLIELSDRVSFLAFALPVVSLAAFAGSVYFAPRRGDATFRLGLGLTIVAAIVLLALSLGSLLLTENVRNPANEAAADGIWWAFADSLRVAMRLLALAGIVLALGAWWVGNHGWPWGRTTPPPGGRTS